MRVCSAVLCMVCGGERIVTSGDGVCVCVQYVYLDVYIDGMGGV
jgi:hypothetical protein